MSFKLSAKGAPPPRTSELHPAHLTSFRSQGVPQPRSHSAGRTAQQSLPALRLQNKKFCMKDGKLCPVGGKADLGKAIRGRVALGKISVPRRRSAEGSHSPTVKSSRSVKRVSFQAGKENLHTHAVGPKPKRSPSMPDRVFLRECPAFVENVENS